MKPTYKITIPTPCHEDWDAMTPDQLGRFCNSCSKSVIDFTSMRAAEIQQYFVENHGKRICGRFQNKQLDSVIIQIPSEVLYSQIHFHKMFLLALLVVMGTSLLSCKDDNGNKQKIDKVQVIDDSVKTHYPTIGESMYIPKNKKDSMRMVPPPPPPPPKIHEIKLTSSKIKYQCTSGIAIPMPITDSIKNKE